MPDESHLDQRYFIDGYIYNCPFCNRRHVSYSIVSQRHFDWTDTKECQVFFVRCHSCDKTSMHLTYEKLATRLGAPRWGQSCHQFSVPGEVDEGEFLDRAFFYSVPTSFFVLDSRVPRELRALLAEAEGCLKSNFLTGASACARKIVYELAAREKAEGDDYEERIKSLKDLHPEVEPALFDTLVTVQQVTSSKVHENAYDGWEARHLRVILAALAEVLHEIYVVPAVRDDRRKSVLALRDELLGSPGQKKSETSADEPAP
jgi:hypothetical protein